MIQSSGKEKGRKVAAEENLCSTSYLKNITLFLARGRNSDVYLRDIFSFTTYAPTGQAIGIRRSYAMITPRSPALLHSRHDVLS